jgi:hypothetical protein
MKQEQKKHLTDMMKEDEELGLYEEFKQEKCCTPEGQIKRYKDCIGCDKKPFKHEVKVLTKEEVMEGRSLAYEFIDFNKQETLEEVKDLSYWKANAEEDYMKVPISVLRYISELEKQQEQYTIEEQHVGHSIDELNKEYIKGFNEGSSWQQEQIGKSEFLQKLRATLSDAEARRLIFEQFKKK